MFFSDRRFGLPWLLWLPLLAQAAVHHELQVTVNPDQHTIEVTDTITAPATGRLEFALHPGLKPEILTTGVRLIALGGGPFDHSPPEDDPEARDDVAPEYFRVQLPPEQANFTLRYAGRIEHVLRQRGAEYARSFSETPGTISAEGVFLSGQSYWYPHIADELVTFDLELRLPDPWFGMSQGDRLARDSGSGSVRERWRCDSPQDEIYLIAGIYKQYTGTSEGAKTMVLLREPDPALARTYLDTSADYIKLYSSLIGPYPYTKFAVVENFWETGYGMPSFTLLGPKVIRFPFILHSSFPHEILHNWWGNGVYVDYEKGNWAEGLTSYLADHMIAEQRGQGVEYRRTVLQKYTNYVRRQQDFPLTEFRGRHSAVTEAVGYGKTQILFHMLRRQLGDALFVDGLRALYRQYRFRVADFAAVEKVFSATAGRSFGAFFDQWVRRVGAARLRITRASARRHTNGYVLSVGIEQTQPGAAYELQVPIAVHLEARDQAYQTTVQLEAKHVTVDIELPARPLRLDVDPEFDVFRRLHRAEVPPAISQLMGAERVLIVLPGAAPVPLKRAYQALARSWQGGDPDNIAICFDHEIGQLPADRAVWLFGWRNRFRFDATAALGAYDFKGGVDRVSVASQSLQQDKDAVVVLWRQDAGAGPAVGWLAAERIAALPGLARKLPHYGKYSYLAFSGDEPINILKGQWPVVDSPMSVSVVQEEGTVAAPASARLTPRTALAPLPGSLSDLGDRSEAVGN